MKIYTKVVYDWDGNVLEEESFEYFGPVALCKGPEAPKPTEQELTIMEKQADALDLANQLTIQQMESAEETRKLLAELAPDAAEIAELKKFQSTQLSLAQNTLKLQQQAMDDAATLRPAELKLRQQSLDVAQKQLNLLTEAINKPPTEFEKGLEEIGLLQIERQKKALAGELPISEGTIQNEQKEFERLKENLSRKGVKVQGDSLEGATSTSTIGIQALQSLKKRYDVIKDAERRGEISQGGSQLLQSYNIAADIGNRQTGLLGFNPYAPSAVPGTVDPTGKAVSLLTSAGNFGFSQSQAGALNVASGLSQSLQPFQFQRGLEFQANQAAAANKTSLISSIFGAAGSAALGYGIFKAA